MTHFFFSSYEIKKQPIFHEFALKIMFEKIKQI